MIYCFERGEYVRLATRGVSYDYSVGVVVESPIAPRSPFGNYGVLVRWPHAAALEDDLDLEPIPVVDLLTSIHTEPTLIAFRAILEEDQTSKPEGA